ncbi:MAG: glycosyltransferase [Candidatus Staskawiczbacteria bacterium]|nr:glycosyltransferase [Candidatus Staskawiczbacteria bacterium]MBI3337262.1 glycosyltransferase [Candidatus Staskawiczbacteria bacterium]
MTGEFKKINPVKSAFSGISQDAKQFNRVKVAYFYTIFRNAAMARWVRNITDNIDQNKYAVSFVGLKIEESFTREIPKNICVVNLSNPYIKSALFKLIAYLRKERPDIFVAAFPHINVLAMMAKVLSGAKVKVVLTDHNHFFGLASNARSLYRRFFGMFILPHLMRIFYPLSDSVICASEGVAESILDVVKIPDKVKVIYYPVAADRIQNWSKEPVNHPWFSQATPPLILGAGRLINQKDFPTLLCAFNLVLKTMPARLAILGEGKDRGELEKLAKELGISDKVAFLGFQKNPFKYMKNASVFVLSSIHEGFGNVLVEAMACGTPVISTDCKSGPGEIIENGKSGILVPVGDYKSLSKAIIRVLSDSSLRQSFSKEGIKRVRYFSVEKNIKQYEDVFQKLMNQN